MLSKRKSFFSWRQNRAQRSVKLRIFEVEARSAQASRHDPLTLQDRGIHHFAETQPQRKRRDRQHRRAMKGTASDRVNSRLVTGLGATTLTGPDRVLCLQHKLDHPSHIGERYPADPLPAAAQPPA